MYDNANTTGECPHGHPKTPENTYVNPRGARECRTCRARHFRRQTRLKTLLLQETKRHNPALVASILARIDLEEAQRAVGGSR